MKHQELCGPVELVEIFRGVGAGSDTVVRWCPKCGAVAVDEDVEGTIRPGFYMKMRFPTLAGEQIARQLVGGARAPNTLSEKDQGTLLEDVGRRTRDSS